MTYCVMVDGKKSTVYEKSWVVITKDRRVSQSLARGNHRELCNIFECADRTGSLWIGGHLFCTHQQYACDIRLKLGSV